MCLIFSLIVILGCIMLNIRIKKTNNITTKNMDNFNNISEKCNSSEMSIIENKLQDTKEITEIKESDADRYLKKFEEGLEYYDLNKSLDHKFIEKLISNKELEYEKYMKYGGTRQTPRQFVVFDLETTGLDEKKSEIIEIGAIRFVSDTPKQIFHTYVKPNKKITQKITSINGITNEMVENAPTLEEVLPKFIDFIKEDVLIAYNAPFDMKFILENMYRLGYKKIKNKVIDVLILARRKIREFDFEYEKERKLSSYKLEELNWRFMLNLPSHNSLDDCKVCAYVYMAIDKEAGGVCYVEI